MLIQISIKNYKTFLDKVTLNLLATNYDKQTKEKENIIVNKEYDLRMLKSAVIFGANAGGKSKLIEGLSFMREFVINSFKEKQQGDAIDVTPFLLNTSSRHAPSEFEVIFISNEVMYRYGFEVNEEEVISEWLYTKPGGKEIGLFYRDHEDVKPHAKRMPKALTLVKEGFLRSNALLLSTAAQFNDDVAGDLVSWFRNFKMISGLHEHHYAGFTLGSVDRKPEFKKRIMELLKVADMGIQDVKPIQMDADNIPKNLPRDLRDSLTSKMKEKNAVVYTGAATFHKVFDENKKQVELTAFSLDDDESSGTQKFFALSGPLLDVLDNGYCLFVDELDSKLHPNLVCKIVSLFNSADSNPRNAQLIFNTHDTNLLSSGLFRRDQIWFIQKNKFEESQLYSLADFKTETVRKNESFEENYLKGKYGGIPFLNTFSEISTKMTSHENEG